VLLDHGGIAKRLLAAAAAAGLKRIVVAIDVPERNVHRLASPVKSQSGESIDTVAIDRLDPRPIPSGIFSAALKRPDILFQHRRESPPLVDASPAPNDLQVILINSAFENDSQMMAHLCQTFPRTITELFKSWMTVPQELRQTPEGTRAYGNALIQIAQLMSELCFEGPLLKLNSPDDNPISRWHHMISSAQMAAAQGHRGPANHELEAILTEMQGASGSAIDDLRPKVLGMIGTNHFHDGRIDLARQMSRQALEACQQVGDEQGVSVYQQNLQLLESMSTEDDVSVAQLYRAQDLSDQGRYEASNAILKGMALDVASIVTCKVHGLLGANYFWLGDRGPAERHAQEAFKMAERIGDPDACRVYSYNLTRIRELEGQATPSMANQRQAPFLRLQGAARKAFEIIGRIIRHR
jgi:tetratricopeptide (TPR) repeat protein